jgi:hypothetical protein
MVIAIRAIRHSRGLATTSSATAALAATTHPAGALCAPITRSQNTATHKGYSLRKTPAFHPATRP